MKPPLIALLDWDNTLSQGFTITRWAAFLAARGLFRSADAQSIARYISDYAGGTVTYSQLASNVPEHYASGLKGQHVERIEHEARTFVNSDAHNLFAFTATLVTELAAADISPIVISGAPTEILAVYRERLHLSRIWGVEVEKVNGRYAGALSTNPATRATKQAIIDAEVDRSWQVVLALGDSESDLPLLSIASARLIVDNPTLMPAHSHTLHASSRMTPAEAKQTLRELLQIASGETK